MRADSKVLFAIGALFALLVFAVVANWIELLPNYFGIDEFSESFGFVLYTLMILSGVLSVGPGPIPVQLRLILGGIALFVASAWIPLFNSIPSYWALIYFGALALSVLARETVDYHARHQRGDDDE